MAGNSPAAVIHQLELDSDESADPPGKLFGLPVPATRKTISDWAAKFGWRDWKEGRVSRQHYSESEFIPNPVYHLAKTQAVNYIRSRLDSVMDNGLIIRDALRRVEYELDPGLVAMRLLVEELPMILEELQEDAEREVQVRARIAEKAGLTVERSGYSLDIRPGENEPVTSERGGSK